MLDLARHDSLPAALAEAFERYADHLCLIEANRDRPFYVQFGHFLGNAVQGEFGLSYRQGRKVSTLIVERFPATLELSLAAAVLALAIGVPLGVYTALRAPPPEIVRRASTPPCSDARAARRARARRRSRRRRAAAPRSLRRRSCGARAAALR